MNTQTQLNGLAKGIVVAPLITSTSPEIVLLNLRICRPGLKRKVATSQVEVDADKTSIQVSKHLLECPQYEAVEKFDREIRTWTTRKCLPAHKCLKEGVYRVSTQLLQEVEQDLVTFAATREKLVTEMAVAYTSAIEAAQLKLRSLFNATDYPTATDFIAGFRFSWQYFTMSAPAELPDVLRLKETQKFAEFQRASLDECRDALRMSFAELVNRAVDRLGSDKDGKALKFNSSLVEKMEDFLTYFQARNLADDTTLEQLVSKAKGIMKAVPSATALREDFDLRTQCRLAFEGIQDALIENGIVEAPTRLIEL